MKKVWMAAALAAVAGGAAAQTYVEGAYGVTQGHANCSDLSTCDKSDKGFKLLAGYTFAPQLSAEAGYIDFGGVRASGNYLGLGSVSARMDTEALFVGGALRIPNDLILSDAIVVLRAGLANVKSKVSLVDLSTGAQSSEHGTSLRPLLGVALQYNLKPELALTASLDVTRTAKVDHAGGGRVSLFSLGAQYAFDPLPLAMDRGLKGRKLNYVYAELGIVHSDGLDVLKRKFPGQYEFDDNPLGGRVALGRRWGPIWSTEVALTNYGQYKFHTVPSAPTQSEGSVAAGGFSVMSVWRAATEMDLTWVARLGLSHNTSRIEPGNGAAIDDRRTTAPIVGLGLEHAFDKDWRLMITADATRIRVGADRPLVKFYAAGGSFRF
jgi:hypothetical protein